MGILITEFPKVITDDIEARVAEVTKFIILRTWQNLTLPPSEGGTPRATGYASASWIISIGEPSEEVGGEKSTKFGSYAHLVDYSPAARGLEQLRGYQLNQGAIFLVNNTPYIWRLNFGWSPQQSAGFVERAHTAAINEAESKFQTL